MQKLLIVTSGFPLYEREGLNVFMLEFAQTLSKDFEVFVLAPFSKQSLMYEKIGSITVYRHKQFPFINAELAYGSGIMGNIKKNPFLLFVVPFFFLLQLFAIRKILKKHSVDIINAHWIIPQGVTAVLYKKLFDQKIKILGTAHGGDLFGLNNLIANSLKQWIYRNLDAISVVSSLLKAQVEKYSSLEVKVIPMGIDTDLFNPEKANEAIKKDIEACDPLLLFVGSCIPEKGLIELIEAMALVVEKNKNVHLLLIGEGYLIPSLKKRVDELRIEKNVTFKGSIPNEALPAYFASSQIFVLPSYSEGYSLALREALSCGVISIVSRIEVFTDDKQLRDLVIFAEPKNVQHLAQVINETILNYSSLELKKRKGREYVQATGDWKVIGSRYHELIKSMLSDRS